MPSTPIELVPGLRDDAPPTLFVVSADYPSEALLAPGIPRTWELWEVHTVTATCWFPKVFRVEAKYRKSAFDPRRLRRACEAALFLLGNDADRAKIGEKPFTCASSVPGILREALE